jgi:hypothetical protein
MKSVLFLGLFLFGGISYAAEEKKSDWSNWVQNFDWNKAVDYVSEQLKITKDQAVDALKGFNDAVTQGKSPTEYWSGWAKKNNKTLPKDWVGNLKEEIRCLIEQNKTAKESK